jgi:hypothetical protein
MYSALGFFLFPITLYALANFIFLLRIEASDIEYDGVYNLLRVRKLWPCVCVTSGSVKIAYSSATTPQVPSESTSLISELSQHPDTITRSLTTFPLALKMIGIPMKSQECRIYA